MTAWPLKHQKSIQLPVFAAFLESGFLQLEIMSRAMGRNREDLEVGCCELLLPNCRMIAVCLTAMVAAVLVASNWRLLIGHTPVWLMVLLLLITAFMLKFASFELHPREEAAPRARTVSGHELIGDVEEQQLHVPPTRKNLPELKVQLILTDRSFDELDYENLKALDEEITPRAPSTSDANTPSTSDANSNARYMVQSHIYSQSMQGNKMKCIICLEQFIVGQLIKTLPCLHQFHARCVDIWLREEGTCPNCKYRVGPGRQKSNHHADEQA